MPHEDGPAFSPFIATVSVGSSTVLEFSDKVDEGSGPRQPFFSLLLMPNSLVVIQDEL